MELLSAAVDLFLHLDEHLKVIIADFGVWTYLILFLVIFFETGIVVTPFLPGDSLLFAAGTMAAGGSFDVALLFVLLTAAAILGDTLNYHIGQFFGPRVLEQKKIRFLKKEHFDRTHEFYEKHGGKTIIIARFMPIVRTFAPFVAGVGSMTYGRFLSYNVIGGVAWIAIFIFGGFFFGSIPFVQNNFEMVILGIILISVLPALFELLRHRFQAEPAQD